MYKRQVPSFFVGTNLIKESLLSEMLVGVGIHNFAFSKNLGLDVAGNFLVQHKGAKLFIGLDYRL